MKDVKIRRAEGKDAYEITKLRHRSWLSAYVKESMATKEEIDKQFNQQLEDKCRMLELEKYFDSDIHNCFVAESDNQLMGIVWLNDKNQEKEPMLETCRMWGLYIEPKFQQQHIGTKLWYFASDYAKKIGYKKLELDTPVQNQNAIVFYENKGGVKVKVYKDELVLGREIDFVEYEFQL